MGILVLKKEILIMEINILIIEKELAFIKIRNDDLYLLTSTFCAIYGPNRELLCGSSNTRGNTANGEKSTNERSSD